MMTEKLRNMTAVYLFRDGKFLLLYRKGGKVADRLYTGSAGGHFEPHELGDPRACVLREMKEEIGISEKMTEGLSLRYITLRHVNGEVRQNYYFFAELRADVPDLLSSNEGTLHWVAFEDALSLEMPFSAKFVVEHYLSHGRYDDKLYGGIATQTDVMFTEMGELL